MSFDVEEGVVLNKVVPLGVITPSFDTAHQPLWAEVVITVTRREGLMWFAFVGVARFAPDRDYPEGGVLLSGQCLDYLSQALTGDERLFVSETIAPLWRSFHMRGVPLERVQPVMERIRTLPTKKGAP